MSRTTGCQIRLKWWPRSLLRSHKIQNASKKYILVSNFRFQTQKLFCKEICSLGSFCETLVTWQKLLDYCTSLLICQVSTQFSFKKEKAIPKTGPEQKISTKDGKREEQGKVWEKKKRGITLLSAMLTVPQTDECLVDETPAVLLAC